MESFVTVNGKRSFGLSSLSAVMEKGGSDKEEENSIQITSNPLPLMSYAMNEFLR